MGFFISDLGNPLGSRVLFGSALLFYFQPYTPNALFSARIIRPSIVSSYVVEYGFCIFGFCVYLVTMSTIFMTPTGKFTILTLHTNNNQFLLECKLFP